MPFLLQTECISAKFDESRNGVGTSVQTEYDTPRDTSLSRFREGRRTLLRTEGLSEGPVVDERRPPRLQCPVPFFVSVPGPLGRKVTDEKAKVNLGISVYATRYFRLPLTFPLTGHTPT